MRIRRLTLIAAATAAIVLAATSCSSSPSAGPTRTTSDPVTSPTSTVAAAVVPFDGDCASFVSSDAIGAVLPGAALRPASLASVPPDLEASLAVLGSINCLWQASAGYVSAAAFPSGVVASGTQAEHSAVACDEYGICDQGVTVGGAWLYVAAPSREALNAVTASATAALKSQPTPSAGARGSGWWTTPECTALSSAVMSGTKQSALEPGFPGDANPGGVVWDVAVANDMSRWCSWYVPGGPIVELTLQPGTGAPSSALLGDAEPITVSGASSAYVLRNAVRNGFPEIVAVSGDNRISVDGGNGITESDLTATAAAAIAQLDQG
jgi:hypothetical protein